MKYYQCRLRRYLENPVYVETITWLEKKYAIGQVPFQMEDRDGTWRNDWKVINAYPTANKGTDYSTQRRVKDA